MIGQPSVNQLASMFMGNPGPLQAEVNKEQQGKPGLPADLRDLLALQIVTNENDAAKRNAAMQQLQQMGTQGPQGEPPTVAQSLQQQAKQKLQAQMVQQMQQQQGLQALAQQQPPGPVPEQTPQPAEQPEPQGLDMLTSNMGDNYAGGGIIAFSGEDDDQEVPEARPLRYESAQDRAEEYIRRKMEARARDEANARRIEALAATIPGQNVQAPQGGERVTSTETDRNIANILSAMPGAGAVRGFAGGARGLMGILGGLLGRDQGEQPAAPVSVEPQPRPGARPTMAQDPRLLTTDQGQGIAGAERAASVVGRPPVSAPQYSAPQAPVAPAEVPTERQKYLQEQFTQPGTTAAAARQDYDTQVGQRPTADLTSLADEIAARRQLLKSRADPLMEFLQGVALAPRGEKWMQSGVRGKLYADEVRAAREAQDMELLQKLIETKGKITDIQHGYKKEKYTAGTGAYKDTYDRVFKSAELMGYDERLAREIAARAAEGELDRKNRLEAARITAGTRGDPAIAAAVNAVKNDEVINSLQKRLEQESKKLGPKAAATVAELERRIAARQDAIYKAFNVSVPASTIGTAPGAGSPGGNRPPLSSFQR